MTRTASTPRIGRPRTLTSADIADIRQARREGAPAAELADMYGVHVMTIYRYTTDLYEPQP